MCTFFQFNDFITWCEVLSVQLEPDAAEGCTGVNFYQTERNKTRAAQAWTLRHSTSLKSDSLFPGIMDTTLLDKWFQDLHQSELFVNMTFISSRIIWEAVGTVTLKNHRVHTSKCHSVIMESKYWRLHTKHFKRCWMKHTTERVTMIFRLLHRQNLFLRWFPACVLSANCRFFGVACKISQFIQSELTNCVLQRWVIVHVQAALG